MASRWKPGSRDIQWERTITAIDASNHTIQVDAPITTAIESRLGGGKIEIFTWPGRLHNVGVENCELISELSTENPKDEDHAWFGVTMENVTDAWGAAGDLQTIRRIGSGTLGEHPERYRQGLHQR